MWFQHGIDTRSQRILWATWIVWLGWSLWILILIIGWFFRYGYECNADIFMYLLILWNLLHELIFECSLSSANWAGITNGWFRKNFSCMLSISLNWVFHCLPEFFIIQFFQLILQYLLFNLSYSCWNHILYQLYSGRYLVTDTWNSSAVPHCRWQSVVVYMEHPCRWDNYNDKV